MAITAVSPDTARWLDCSVSEVLDLGFRYALVTLDDSARCVDQLARATPWALARRAHRL